MTVFFNDSLANQIERGEVWYYTKINQFVEPGADDDWLITTGANACSVIFEMLGNVHIRGQIYENPTSVTGAGTKTTYNMRRDSAESISTTIEPCSGLSGGTRISEVLALHGVFPQNSPFSRDVGLILKPNEEYVYRFTNYSDAKAPWTYNVFFREL